MKFKVLPSLGVLAFLVSGQAFAQTTAASEADDEIVVTGSSIRGIAPAGANIVGLSQEDVIATGANSTADLLTEIPQANSFNQMPQPGGSPGGNFNSVIQQQRVTLRPLPGDQAGGSMQTLVLVDGHRIAPLGLGARMYVDPNVIAPGLIERVEAIVGGGSAVYGSDAFTGAINFITRRRFDGVEASARYGFGEQYESWGHTIIAGEDWGSGSIFGAYDYSQNDAIFGRDRDWIRDYSAVGGVPTGRTCAAPTISAGGNFYDADGTQIAAPNACDLSDDRSFYPRINRYSFSGGFTQDLSDTVTFDIRGYIARQNSIGYSGTFGQTSTITSANPYYRPIPGDGGTQSVAFDFSPAFGPTSQKVTTSVDSWQLTPELTWSFGNDWQVRGILSHGETELGYRNVSLDNTAVSNALAGTTVATALNPYDVASTNTALLASFLGSSSGAGNIHFSNARVIADGPLFELPGGEVHAAVGAEYLKTEIDQFNFTSTTNTLMDSSADQDDRAFFAEVQAPIISPEMGVPLVHSLAVQISVRNDRYSDFGETTNAAYGLTYEPIDWVTFRANYNDAFLAPTPVEQSAITSVAGTVLGEPGAQNAVLPNGQNIPDGNGYLNLSGSKTPLDPQTAQNYSIGFDIRPPMVEGLQLSATFWHVGMMDRLTTPIACPQTDFVSCFYPFFPANSVYFVDPTDEQIRQTLALDASGADLTRFDPDCVGPDCVAVDLILDNRTQNLGNVDVEGWDLGAAYSHPTSWGSWDARVNGTIYNVQRQNSGGTSPWVNRNLTAPEYTFTASAGATVGNFRGQASVNYTAARDNNVTPTGDPAGGEVDAFHPVDLFFSYTFEGAGLTEDLRLTMNVNNAFDDDPPNPEIFTGTAYGVGSIMNLGRVVQFGVSKRF